jgi:hypothetical protein
VLKRDLIIVVLLVVTAIWRWSPIVATDLPLPDERVYLRAADHVAAGESPYAEPGYLYPPPLAYALASPASAIGAIGAIDSLRILRFLSLAGIVVSVWLSARLVHWHPALVAGLSAAFVATAPPVDNATSLGNVGGAANGLVLTGLLCWHARPVSSGISIGAGLVLKPIAPLAPLLILAHRPRTKSTRPVTAALVTITAAAALLAPSGTQLVDFLGNARGHANPYNFSLHKLLADLGLELPPLAVSATVATLAIVILRRATVSRTSLLAIVIGTNLLALPILWAHMLLLLLPVQFLALDACARAFARQPGAGHHPRSTVALASVAVAATLLAHAVGTTYDLPAWAALIARAVPMCSIAFLTWFVVIDLERRSQQLDPRT